MKRNVGILVAGGLLSLCAQANADMVVDLGGGWEATIFSDDVGLVVDGIYDDTLVIQKFATFRDIDPNTGQPDPVRIAFSQTLPDDMTITRIAINDEVVANLTGLDWTSYRNVLVGPATWNQADSADFLIDPFTMRQYSADSREVEFFGGVVADGTIWTPGIGQDGGWLVMDIDLSGPDPAKFFLKEIPTPAPGAVTLLGVAGLVGRRRRRG